MIRAVAAVFVGFVVMAAIVNIPLVLFALKPAAAFEYGTTDVMTTGWMALSIVMAVVAAPCGGYVAAVIARSPTNRPVMALAGIVFMLGILSAIGQLGEMPGARDKPAVPIEACRRGGQKGGATPHPSVSARPRAACPRSSASAHGSCWRRRGAPASKSRFPNRAERIPSDAWQFAGSPAARQQRYAAGGQIPVAGSRTKGE